jgi:hypothetical protein
MKHFLIHLRSNAVMKSKYISFLLILAVLLGQFALPISSFACGNQAKKQTAMKKDHSCCKKMTTQSEEKTESDCCKNHSSKKENKEDGCGGQCNDSSCSCPSANLCFSLPITLETPFSIGFIASEKSKFYYKETYFSTGFLSIWLPPVIG